MAGLLKSLCWKCPKRTGVPAQQPGQGLEQDWQKLGFVACKQWNRANAVMDLGGRRHHMLTRIARRSPLFVVGFFFDGSQARFHPLTCTVFPLFPTMRPPVTASKSVSVITACPFCFKTGTDSTLALATVAPMPPRHQYDWLAPCTAQCQHSCFIVPPARKTHRAGKLGNRNVGLSRNSQG